MWILVQIRNILMNQLKYTEGDFGRLEGLFAHQAFVNLTTPFSFVGDLYLTTSSELGTMTSSSLLIIFCPFHVIAYTAMIA